MVDRLIIDHRKPRQRDADVSQIEGRNVETGQWAGERVRKLQASEPFAAGAAGVACMHVVRCALCHLCCRNGLGKGGHRHSHARLAGRPREREYRAWKAMPGPGPDWQREVHGTCMAYLAGVPCPSRLRCPWLGNEVSACKPAQPVPSLMLSQTSGTLYAQLCSVLCMSCEPPSCAVVPGPQPASRPAMRGRHGLSLRGRHREGGRGAWKFVSMHPWAWADADPQLQG